ncbi:hypothetical protein CDCA_CDCA09G2739 [Cyanidium caldarium]|uniref:Mitochondrial carrier protein n=1 Tax=Cyanidium caldarium TaxID=2771 RepID=A0AAV9IWR3_CYACA|nr:hypothetical protein CDCA_CDCA09G2739 [Cyanidium caldarium]
MERVVRESTVEAITAETRGAVASGSERIGNIERTESAADACTATGPRHGLDAFPIADDRCPDKMARFRACSVAVDTLSDSSPSEAITASASAETTADPRRDTLKSLVAGGAAGAVAKTCMAPIDRTKILLQVSRIHGDTRAYVSVLSTVRTIFHEEGVRGFFRGNSATLTRIAPYAAIQFSAFETCNGLLTRRYTAWRRRDHTDEASQAPPTALRFVAGAAAGTTAVIATYPLDVVRTRLAAHTLTQLAHAAEDHARRTARRHGILHELRSLHHSGGLRALYPGLAATLVGIVPYAGVNFYTYGLLRQYLTTHGHMERHATVSALACGGVAGLFGQTLAYPLETLRRRAHCSPPQRSATSAAASTVNSMAVPALDGWESALGQQPLRASTAAHRRGVWRSLVDIVRSEGVLALYRGLSLNYVKTAPTVGISFAVYEKVREWLGAPPSSYSAARGA